MDQSQIEWPREGDKAFRAFLAPGDDGMATAMVSTRPSLHTMAKGYRVAVQKLADRVVAGGSEPDHIIFAFAFLWRQYLELELKSLLPLANLRLLGPGAAANLPEGHPNHKIAAYWNCLAPLLESIAEDEEDRAGLRVVDRVLRELASYDPDSFTFRYPTDRRSGAPTMSRVPRAVSLLAIHEAMCAVATFLESVHAQLSDDVRALVRGGQPYPDGWYDMEGPEVDEA